MLVAVGDTEAVARGSRRCEFLEQALLVWLAQDIAGASATWAEFGTDQGAATELELAQVPVDRLQVVVVELTRERRGSGGRPPGEFIVLE